MATLTIPIHAAMASERSRGEPLEPLRAFQVSYLLNMRPGSKRLSWGM
jgi:hypothetical protein